MTLKVKLTNPEEFKESYKNIKIVCQRYLKIISLKIVITLLLSYDSVYHKFKTR